MARQPYTRSAPNSNLSSNSFGPTHRGIPERLSTSRESFFLLRGNRKMARQDVISAWSAASFMVRSTARRLRLGTNDPGDSNRLMPWDFVRVINPNQNYAHVSFNGPTASSSLASGILWSGNLAAQILPHTVQDFWTHATSISGILSGATAAAIVVVVGRH